MAVAGPTVSRLLGPQRIVVPQATSPFKVTCGGLWAHPPGIGEGVGISRKARQRRAQSRRGSRYKGRPIPGASRFSAGDRVYGLVAGGAYAEQIVAHEREVAPIPAGLATEEAAAIPEAFLTAYDALVVQARLAPGERVLIHAAGSGVGTAGVQIARALGCFVIGTSRTADKLERAKELGLDAGLLTKGATFAAAVLDATNKAGADVVLELVGGAYVAEDLRATAQSGRIVLVGLTAGAQGEIDLGLLLRKRITLKGTVMRARPLEEKIQAAQLLERSISPWVAKRIVKPVVDRVFPLEEAAAAHAYVAADQSFGKVLLRIGAPIV